MSFDYDHDAPFVEGSKPDIHRLRARAAKSAVRRARDIYNPEAARNYLESIDDPIIRAKAAIKLKGEAQKEIQFMGNELMRLLPIGADAPDGMPPIEFEPSFDDSEVEMKNDHKRSKMSTTFSSSTVDRSSWTTNKPEPRSLEVKDENNDEVIRTEYGEDAVNDPIFREMRSKDVYYNSEEHGQVFYDSSNSSKSSSVKESLRKETTKPENQKDNDDSHQQSEPKVKSLFDDEDVYYV